MIQLTNVIIKFRNLKSSKPVLKASFKSSRDGKRRRSVCHEGEGVCATELILD